MIWLAVIPGVPVVLLAILWLMGERGHLALPSTRSALHRTRAASAARRPSGRLGQALHGYVYGRWPEQYIAFARRLLPWATPRAKRRWADRYHGKVLPHDLACAIVRLDHDIKRTDLERIIPYPAARDLLLSGPPSVTLLDCPCRAGKPHPCEPVRVCMLVSGGDFVLDHRPGKAERVTREAALEVLRQEHERGHVHTAYFKDACDNRFYAICNCCKCCCGGIEAMVEHGVPMVASSGYVAEVDQGACIACGDCAEACPFGAMAMPDRAEVDWERCMGCGVCEGRCATDAITLVLDERKGLPLDVRRIGMASA